MMPIEYAEPSVLTNLGLITIRSKLDPLMSGTLTLYYKNYNFFLFIVRITSLQTNSYYEVFCT